MNISNHSFLLFPRIRFSNGIELIPVPNKRDENPYTTDELKPQLIVDKNNPKFEEIKMHFEGKLGTLNKDTYSLKGFAFPTIEKFNKWIDNIRVNFEV